MQQSDEQDDWVERLNGDPAGRDDAIEELRELLMRGLTRSLTNRYGTAIQIDDVVQEALLKILASLGTFEGRSRFTTWAMTIATRIGISELRRKHYRDVSLNSMTTGDNLTFDVEGEEGATAETQDSRHNILSTLHQLIDDVLTPRQREATQGILDGLPVEEVARRTGSNRNAVYKLVHDARVRLRDAFEERGVSLDDVNGIFA